MKEQIVGIIGGMGPEATVDLMARVIKGTPALDDIDHIRMIVDNNPKVPSRIKALLEGGGEDPTSCLQDMARKLYAWGVDFLAIPCNTAHYYHKQVQQSVPIPILDMIDLTHKQIRHTLPKVDTIGILASTAVLNLKLYEYKFSESGIRMINPSDELQTKMMEDIKTIKTGSYGSETVENFQNAANYLSNSGAQAILVACTELSILSSEINTEVPLFDSAQILAEAIIQKAKNLNGRN